ncbi:MAG: sodium:proton antiporter [Planococcaceae bacterium]|nr:sodium:proton antiporter [Planococcaceae bacterium]
MHLFNEVFIQILILLAISISVIAIANLVKQPYSIALVLVGLLLGLTDIPVIDTAEQFITQSSVFQAIIISLFLPILLGDATLKLEFSVLYQQRKPILALALIGTFLSFLIIGFGTLYVIGLPLIVAFTFAALMSATDPISVLSIFKSLGVSKKLAVTIEGESLLNDGIAVVLFQISTIYLITYIQMGIAGFGSGVLLFMKFSVGGLVIGLLLGFIFSQLLRPFDDYPLEVAFSALLFFGSYFIAEHFHVSGVIAVVVGGLVFGNYGAKIGMSKQTKVNINTFWDSITQIANSLIFLMIGLEIRHIDFADKWGIIVLGILIVIVGRAIAVYTSTTIVKGLSFNEKHIINWGGLKGSLSIALALSLPPDFQGKETILLLTFSVVLFSLLVQGLTIKPLVRKLGVLPSMNK